VQFGLRMLIFDLLIHTRRLLSEDNFNPYSASEQTELLSALGDFGVERDRLWHTVAMVHRVGYMTCAFGLLYPSYTSFRLGLDIWEPIKITGESQYDIFILALLILVVSLCYAWMAFNEIRSVNHITRQSESGLAQVALWAGLLPLSFTGVELYDCFDPGPVAANINYVILAIGAIVLWYVTALYRLQKARRLPLGDANSS
jgi:hypothetical protein